MDGREALQRWLRRAGAGALRLRRALRKTTLQPPEQLQAFVPPAPLPAPHPTFPSVVLPVVLEVGSQSQEEK